MHSTYQSLNQLTSSVAFMHNIDYPSFTAYQRFIKNQSPSDW